MARNKNWFYHAHQGIKVTKDIAAEIGLMFGDGAEFSFNLETEVLSNFTVDEDGVTGTKVNPGEATTAIQMASLDPKENTDTLTSDFAPRAAYNIGDTIKVAMYISDVSTEAATSNSYPYMIFYNPDNNQFLTYYYNPSNQSNMGVNINNITKLKTQDMRPNGSVSNVDYRLSVITGTAYYGVNNYWVNGDYFYNIALSTNVPVFDTEAHARAYLVDSEDLQGLLNGAEVDPSEAYEDRFSYHYIRNVIGKNTQTASAYTAYRNYRFYNSKDKMCFYRVDPSASSPWDLRLYNYENYEVKKAPVYGFSDDDFEVYGGFVEDQYLDENLSFDDDYYTSFVLDTDLLIFDTKELADAWIADLIDARQASNYNQVSRRYNDIVDPGYGDPDPGNDNGINGQSYVHGARMWVLSSSQLNHFFDDIFDPNIIDDILDGTKLFGSNEINAIQGISYFPVDLDDVATVYGSAQPIKIGSYQLPTATGRYVQNNNKMIDCGGFFVAPVYNDFRDYRIRLFISLPYCGVHELSPISKYMGHTLSVKYAVDVTSGACSAHVLSDGISYGDTFDGYMASQRPLSAIDQTAFLNSVMSCVSSIVSREGGMIEGAKQAYAGVATGKADKGVKGVSGGGIDGLSTSMGAISDLYGLSQAVREQPMATRGGFAGCLGFFGNQKIHIITAQAKTVKPQNELTAIGYPSGMGGTVGMFSGFLKCSVFRMASGFTGTLDELNEIISIMSGGIYL